jgi:CMP-N,N'-diacetyllegionaminic acid synthase
MPRPVEGSSRLPSVLAVVPARGGSKGISGKNLRLVGGKSLIAHAADVIDELSFVGLAVLSTDHPDIAEEGRKSGLTVIDRPPELATDGAKGVDAWRHAWLEGERLVGHHFGMSLLIQPTSPLRIPSDLEQCIAVIDRENRDAVITVSPTPGHFTPEKTLRLSGRGSLEPYLGSGVEWLRQRTDRYFFLNGYGYLARRHVVVDERRILTENTGAVIIDRPVVNIDEPFDLELAEWLYRRQRREFPVNATDDDASGSGGVE